MQDFFFTARLLGYSPLHEAVTPAGTHRVARTLHLCIEGRYIDAYILVDSVLGLMPLDFDMMVGMNWAFHARTLVEWGKEGIIQIVEIKPFKFEDFEPVLLADIDPNLESK